MSIGVLLVAMFGLGMASMAAFYAFLLACERI